MGQLWSRQPKPYVDIAGEKLMPVNGLKETQSSTDLGLAGGF